MDIGLERVGYNNYNSQTLNNYTGVVDVEQNKKVHFNSEVNVVTARVLRSTFCKKNECIEGNLHIAKEINHWLITRATSSRSKSYRFGRFNYVAIKHSWHQ